MTITAKQPAKCKVCGSIHLTWQATIVNHSDVQRCDTCSETLMTISADMIADLMNSSTGPSAVLLEPPTRKGRNLEFLNDLTPPARAIFIAHGDDPKHREGA
ncbi:hypothetical protein [Janthinobacterium sp. CAN_S7]|uniref:hypothetical protein n=1 Tax=Janthinobacterium sp. CAN_S7 TaxID=3071704 RepID=UPI00319DDF79